MQIQQQVGCYLTVLSSLCVLSSLTVLSFLSGFIKLTSLTALSPHYALPSLCSLCSLLGTLCSLCSLLGAALTVLSSGEYSILTEELRVYSQLVSVGNYLVVSDWQREGSGLAMEHFMQRSSEFVHQPATDIPGLSLSASCLLI